MLVDWKPDEKAMSSIVRSAFSGSSSRSAEWPMRRRIRSLGPSARWHGRQRSRACVGLHRWSGQVGYPKVRVQIGLLFLKIGFYVLEETVVVVIRLEVADQSSMSAPAGGEKAESVHGCGFGHPDRWN